MRVLALDIGERRIGVAVSDVQQRVATPLVVLDAAVLREPKPLLELVDDYEVGCLVIGLPLSLNGVEGPQAQKVKAAGESLARNLGVPVIYADERLSSAEASRAMRAAGVSERDQRGRLDMVAAALFLQSYLDSRAEAVERDVGSAVHTDDHREGGESAD